MTNSVGKVFSSCARWEIENHPNDEDTMAYVITPQPIPTLGVEGPDSLPVQSLRGKLFCIVIDFILLMVAHN